MPAVFHNMVLIDSSTDLSALICANSYSSVLMDNDRGFERPHG